MNNEYLSGYDPDARDKGRFAQVCAKNAKWAQREESMELIFLED